VVALHGCAGLGKHGIAERYRDWAERLTGMGFVVLFPDSFGSRGLGPQCRVSDRSVRASGERVEDAAAARRWLQEQPFVKGDRVSLLGWSNGATTVLYAVRPEKPTDRNGPRSPRVRPISASMRSLNEASMAAARRRLAGHIASSLDNLSQNPGAAAE
jgi:dienelactone hydrolase